MWSGAVGGTTATLSEHVPALTPQQNPTLPPAIRSLGPSASMRGAKTFLACFKSGRPEKSTQA